MARFHQQDESLRPKVILSHRGCFSNHKLKTQFLFITQNYNLSIANLVPNSGYSPPDPPSGALCPLAGPDWLQDVV